MKLEEIQNGNNVAETIKSLTGPDNVFLVDASLLIEKNENKFFVANPTTPVKLSIGHEEELVAMALKLNSASMAIKWYYKTYRPDDYILHNQKRDWTKTCRLRTKTVDKWMAKFKKSGYHRLRSIKKLVEARPKTGLNSIPTIKLTECQKNILVSQNIESGQSARDSIKSFVKEHFPKEFINHEIYDDWDRCSITVNKVNNWVRNVNTAGCITPTWKYPSSNKHSRKLAEDLLRAECEIEEMKRSCKNKLEMASNLTGTRLAVKMGISRKTANRYLNILERQGQEDCCTRRQVLNKKKMENMR